MEFQPNTTIYLCNVPFDSSYKHQYNFATPSSQYNYFLTRNKISLTDYLTVREKQPDGSVLSYIRIDVDIETLRGEGCNYLVYQNHGGKRMYAFITNMVYINEGLTKIFIETDVWQTYCFDLEIMSSFIVRQHSETDEIGDNVVPEQFNFDGYNYHKIGSNYLQEWGYLVALSRRHSEDKAPNIFPKSGIAQGLAFYYFKDITAMEDFRQNLSTDCIEMISVIPKFNIGDAKVSNIFGDFGSDWELDLYDGNGLITSSTKPASEKITIDFSTLAFTFDGYEPKNNKLFTAPFTNIVVSNNTGGEMVLNREDFSDTTVEFEMFGDISVNPSVMLVPLNYKKQAKNMLYTISLSGFPQCSNTADYYKLWLAKNSGTSLIGLASGAATMTAGFATAVTGVGVGVGAMGILYGAKEIANTINGAYQASKTENPSTNGNPHNNLLTAMKENTFKIYYRMIKKDYAESVDNFFTMYGYAVNKLQTPNLNARPYYTYIQTIDVNVRGKKKSSLEIECSIPTDDMKRFKDIFNNGVTMWQQGTTMYDYSVDNTP